MNPITENNIETFAIEVLNKLGWQHVHGLSIAPGAECAERENFEQIILTQRLRKAVARLNREIPADGATVRIYYESRLAKVNLDEEGRRLIVEFDKELEEDEEITDKQRVRAKWTKLEALVGNPERIKNLVGDIVTHFEQRQAVFEGKELIVAMSRRIRVGFL
jgi:type I site-specific restriction-modification system R (restriction) subunit